MFDIISNCARHLEQFIIFCSKQKCISLNFILFQIKLLFFSFSLFSGFTVYCIHIYIVVPFEQNNMASCCSRAISCYSYIHSSAKPAAACCAPNDACQFSQCHNRFVSAAVLHCVLGAVCVCSIHCAIYTGANTFQTGESFTLK